MKKLKLLFIGALSAVVLAAARPAVAATNAESVQKVVKTGTSTTVINSGLVTSDTYTFSNDGRVFLHFTKTGAGSATITVTSQATVQGLAVANLTVTVPATTGDVFMGPFPTSIFNDSSGNVSFTISDTTGLGFSVLSL